MKRRTSFSVGSALPTAGFVFLILTSVAWTQAADPSPNARFTNRNGAIAVADHIQPSDEGEVDEDEVDEGEVDEPELDPLAELESLLSEPVLVGEDIVYSASRREERAVESPATVIVITRDDIIHRGYSQLIDVLRDLPGMETTENYFTEFGTQVPVRGISGNNKIVVLVNGMRVNPPGGENFPFRNDFSVRHAERIEVVYGSASTLYGQDAISAIINVVMQDPGEDTDRIEIGTEFGVNLEREAWGWFATELGCCREVKLSGFVQYHDSELSRLDREFPAYWQGYRDVATTKTNAGGRGVVPSRQDFGLNVYGRIEWRDWSFQVWHKQSERNSAEGYSPILGFLPEALWRDYSTVMEGKNVTEIHEGVTFESRLQYNRYDIDRDSRYFFPASATEWFLDDFKYGRGWSLGLEETLRWDVTDSFTFLVGGLARYSDIIPKATFNGGGFDPSQDPIAQSGSFQYSDTPGGTLINIPQASNVKFWTYAVYAEGQLQMFDWLRLVGGARITWDGHFQDVPVTPRASAIVSVTDEITAKYIYNQGFVQPAPYFAFATYDRGDILAQTNASVDPETAETHEINFTYQDDNLTLGLALYHGTQSNIITVSDQVQPQNIVDNQVFLNGDPAQSRILVQTANGGTSERYGLDFYGKANYDRFDAWFSYSYVDFQETNGGVTTGLPGISRHNGRLGVTWEATCRFFVTPSFVIRSTPENVVRGTLGRELQDPWELNLYLLYRHSECLDAFLDIRNLTDHHYALNGFLNEAIPQEPFRCVAGLRLKY